MKITKKQLRQIIKEEMAGAKAPIHIEQGYFFLDGDKSNQNAKSDGDIIDEHSGPQDMRSFVLALTLLKEEGYTTINDADNPQNPSDIDEYINMLSRLHV